MSSQDEYKASRREKTKEQAVALLDDLEFFRALTTNPAPTAGDLRRLSAQLRRILVDGTIERIAAPRIGRISFVAPDLRFVEKSNNDVPYKFLIASRAKVLGVEMAMHSIEQAERARDLPGFDIEATVTLPLDKFMSQGTMIFEGTWISRRAVIRYIANVADGVHSGEAVTDTERLIRRARHASKMREEDTPFGRAAVIASDLRAFSVIEIPPILTRTDLDGALIELWTTADLLLKSPDVLALEDYVKAEVSA